MHKELRQALEQREKLRSQLQRLGVIGQSETPSEQHVSLYNEYNSQLQAVEARIRSLRVALKSQFVMLQTTIQAYDAKIQRLNAEAASGSAAPENYQREYGKASTARQEAYEKMLALQRMLAAKRPADLEGVGGTIKVAALSPIHRSPSRGDLGLRIAAAVIGALIVLGLFLPAVTVPLAGSVSLYDMQQMASEFGYSKGVMLFYAVMLFGFLVALSAVAPYEIRGYWLLLLGTLGLGAMIYAVAFTQFGSHGIDDEIAEIVSSLTSPGVGIILLILGGPATYLLAAVTLWTVDGGKAVFVVSLGVLLVVGVGGSAFFAYRTGKAPGSAQTYRAVLRNKNGRSVVSNELAVKPANGGSTVTPPPPAVEALRELARTANLNQLDRPVYEARTAVDRMTDTNAARRLRLRIDQSIADVKSRLAAPIIERARRCYERQDLKRAQQYCNEVFQLYAMPPWFEVVSPEGYPAQEEAYAILSEIAIQDPTQRYRVLIIMTAGDSDSAKARIEDTIRQVTRTVEEGDTLEGDYRIERIGPDEGVVLRRGRETVILTREGL